MNSKKEKIQFKGPKSSIVNNQEYRVNLTKLTHIKTGNVFVVKEIQDNGFIVWLTRTLGTEVKNETNIYISYGNLNEYK